MSKAVSKGNTFLLFKMDCIRVYLTGGWGGGGERTVGGIFAFILSLS